MTLLRCVALKLAARCRTHLRISDMGKRNVIVLAPGVRATLRGEIIIRGDDNQIEIGPNCHAMKFHAELGSGCSLSIGRDSFLSELFIYAANNNRVTIGTGINIGGEVRLLLHEPGSITIGDGCLFADQIDVSLSDMHSIVDVNSGLRVNPPADVTIGDRVWVGVRVMILKGSHIQSGSIVGACAVVSGNIPENSVAAGTPAKVVRSGVTWKHELLPVVPETMRGLSSEKREIR